MKRTSLFVWSLAIVASLFSCRNENQEIIVPESACVPMILKASLDNAATKATVTAGATGLKSTWDENDKISVLTLDASGNLVYNDVFTSTNAAGATNAEFSGTFRGGEVANAQIVCYYPALVYESKDAYNNTQYSNAETTPILRSLKLSAVNYFFEINYGSQEGNDNTRSVSKNLILSGVATIDGDELTTTLNHRIAVLKVTVVNANTILKNSDNLRITSSKNSFEGSGWSRVATSSGFLAQNTGYATNSQILNLLTTIALSEENRDLVFYMPVVLNSMEAGDTWTIEISGRNLSMTDCTKTVVKTFSKDMVFQPGVCYPITLQASEFSE